MDAILLIIDIVYRIVIKSVQQCTYFLLFVNLLLIGVNYGQRTMRLQEFCELRYQVFVLSILLLHFPRLRYNCHTLIKIEDSL
jgi:hypothetical protein